MQNTLQQSVSTPNVGGHSGSRRRNQRNNTYINLRTDCIALEEAAKLVWCKEMAAMPSKTPVSILQELLSRRGSTPKYELVQIEGAIHEPTFRYRVTVADTVAMGTGRSKKEAKHAAAKALLDKLTGIQSTDTITTNGSVPNTGAATPDINGQGSANYEDKGIGNPIGWLQEMCMSRRWPPPHYEMDFEEGLPHERQFTIACVVFKHREVGQGKSKKLAKRQAAHKMWQTLQDAKLDSELGDEENTKLNIPDFNFVQFLQEIASEQQFEVTYVDIEERSHKGRCQCLVQLSTLPVAVCHGSGNTSKDAQASAAQNALEYLKIMTKK
ncbi:interferon-inducible double-stranded RNA-dependent protein kinase activator A homolog isoform X2 [Ctenocephalides felis]|uniref:interferon-inducible double-stranded RNA-dependent protein kinase activator A homolog isoform X2 n=1 Tax=Ctenocephalides felis TaxID=7515 RepID=UPI000E6E20C9|nr:interferon-inducible double-stranded RNA-dependent protein kinase activator A homolog isoform X2 [Ctenocephalides felis]